jgi:hypothetical protein
MELVWLSSQMTFMKPTVFDDKTYQVSSVFPSWLTDHSIRRQLFADDSFSTIEFLSTKWLSTTQSQRRFQISMLDVSTIESQRRFQISTLDVSTFESQSRFQISTTADEDRFSEKILIRFPFRSSILLTDRLSQCSSIRRLKIFFFKYI